MMNKTKILCIWAFLVVLILGTFVSALSESVGLNDYSLDFEYNENDVKPGEVFRIDVTITNEAGETREDIEVSLDLSSRFDNVGDSSRTIGTLEDGDSKTISFRVEVDSDTDEGDYDIDFDVSDNVDSDSDQITVEVKSDKSELVVGEITSLPTIISPDTEDIRLTLTIENIGDGDAEFVRGRLLLPEGFSASNSYSDTFNLGLINEGWSREATFFIDTEEFADSGRHTGRLELEFENDNDPYTQTLTFDLPVKGRPQFIISEAGTSSGKLYPGDESTLRLIILNKGEEEGEETSIRVFENSDQPFEFNEKTNFIGDLKPGESGTGTISFTVDDDALEKEYLIRVQVRTINSGNVLVEEMSVPVRVYAAEKNNNSLIIGGSTAVLVIILLILFYALKRKKN